MKKASNWFLIICLLVFFYVLFSKYYRNDNQYAIVNIKEKIIDIGVRKPNQPINLKFEITNVGDNDFVINNINADCHCTIPSWTKEPIKNGEKAIISVNYNNSNLGYFQQSVTVECNSKNSPLILTLQGKTEE